MSHSIEYVYLSQLCCHIWSFFDRLLFGPTKPLSCKLKVGHLSWLSSVCHGCIVAKWCKRGPRLLLITRPNRKSHAGFQMRWMSLTLDDLEGSWRTMEWNVSSYRSKWPISRKWCEIGPRLLLITNRKSHISFQITCKSSTLVLEWPLRSVATSMVSPILATAGFFLFLSQHCYTPCLLGVKTRLVNLQSLAVYV